MKKSLIALFSAFLMLLLFNINCKKAYTGELKIGYVDFEKIFKSYEKTKDLNEKLQKKKYDKELEGQKMIEEINKIKNQMQILNGEAKEKKQKELKEKIRNFKDFTEDTKDALLKERDRIFKNLTKEIVEAIEDIGKKENYTFIMDSQVFLYKDSSYDLTDKVIKVLNEKYKKEGKKKKSSSKSK